MKKISTLLTIILVTVFTVKATVLTVSNNSNSPGQYTSLQAAIDAAYDGDTILVAGSSTSYGDIDINHPLTIIGAGYHNPYGNNSILGYVDFIRVNADNSASGSFISGFDVYQFRFYGSFSGGDINTQGIDDVTVERCWFDNIYFGSSSSSYSNDTVRNCIVITLIDFYYYTSSLFDNIVIHNNIFNGSNIEGNNSIDLSTCYLRNNLFIDKTTSVFSDVKNMVLENNIFYKAEPTGCSGCTFNNNLTYYNSNNTIPYGDNGGSGNIVDDDPEFVNYPVTGGAFDWAHDFHLEEATSPAIGTGTSGNDIGIYGLPLPYEVGDNPRIPQMIEITFQNGVSSVEKGGDLNVNFKAKKQD